MLCELSNFYLSRKELSTIGLINDHLLNELEKNKTFGVAYYNLKRFQQIECLSDDLQLKIERLHNKYLTRTQEYLKHLEYVTEILSKATFPYAILKGAFLIARVYPIGVRIANDIDILIEEKNIGKCKSLFIKNGFVSGHYDASRKVVPATRKEELEAKMNTGNLLPLFKAEIENLQVDINFSMDFKNDNKNTIEKMLKNAKKVTIHNRYSFSTLDEIDMLVHLCCHLYKDAVTYESVVEGYDLRLYEFNDVNVCLEKYFSGNKKIQDLIVRIKEYSLEKECYFAFYYCKLLFRNLQTSPFMEKLLDSIKPDFLEYMDRVEYKKEGKIYRYSIPFPERLYVENRENFLKEFHLKNGES